MQQEINPKGAVACLTLILPQVIGLHWDNTAASDFLNTAASDWKILPQVMGHPSRMVPGAIEMERAMEDHGGTLMAFYTRLPVIRLITPFIKCLLPCLSNKWP